MEAYLDNAATTQAFDEVCREVEKVMMIDFGNPSSKHILRQHLNASLRKLYLRPAEQNQIIWRLLVRC